MLTLESAAKGPWSLPLVVRFGLVLLLVGGLADVGLHLVTAAAEHGHEFSVAEVGAHLVVVVGMVLILAGVVVDGVRQPRPGRPAGDTTHGGE